MRRPLSSTSCRATYAEAVHVPPPAFFTHYVVVRADLPRGTQAAQLVHAAGESSPGDLPRNTNAVVLTTRDLIELDDLAKRLERAGIDLVRIYEPDEPWCGQLMAIGLRPVAKEVVRRLLSSFPLLR